MRLLACLVTINWHQKPMNLQMCCYIIEILTWNLMGVTSSKGFGWQKSLWIPTWEKIKSDVKMCKWWQDFNF